VDVDLIVIGGGAAGLGAARAARARGATVAIVERGRLGGDCTFTGCIPSKTLLEAARAGTSFAEATARVTATIERVAALEDAPALQREGIEVLSGEARFTGPSTLSVDGSVVSGRAIVLATGADPAIPPVAGLESIAYLTSETVFGLSAPPSSLAIIGAGPLGVELASAFSAFGCETALIEQAPRILPHEEPLASEVIARALDDRRVTLHLGTGIERVEQAGAGAPVRIHLDDGHVLTAERVLVAAGRRPRTAGLGLELAGVETGADGRAVVDRRLRTSAPAIFAAGDVTGPPYLTHMAYNTGRIAALNALSRRPLRTVSRSAIPQVTFTEPEVARVGITEEEAAGRGARVAFLPMSEVDRALTAGLTDGFVKLIAGPRRVTRRLAGGRLLGATIVAPRAGEMLQELVLAVRLGLFPAQIASTLHPYPTWSIAVQQAAAQFFGTYGGRTAR
jgi:pyruvate/2-oxoglutarate dehydrogenase complex dihydrolipoamide dehydrogenase (E3) component